MKFYKDITFSEQKKSIKEEIMSKTNTVFIINYEWSTDGEYFNEIFVYKDYENALDKYEHWKDDDRKYAEETGLACDETVNKDEMKHNFVHKDH